MDKERVRAESDVVVVKIGGSTLGSHDTVLEDVVELHKGGLRPVVVHGGGSLIGDWLQRLGVPTSFERGLRVTDEASLEVVVSVLAGLVNKRLVGQLQALGGPAVGLSGADGDAPVRDRRRETGLGVILSPSIRGRWCASCLRAPSR
jgi:acetylglutamate kinase